MNGQEIYFSFASISESRFFTVVYFFSGMGKVVPFISGKLKRVVYVTRGGLTK